MPLKVTVLVAVGVKEPLLISTGPLPIKVRLPRINVPPLLMMRRLIVELDRLTVPPDSTTTVLLRKEPLPLSVFAPLPNCTFTPMIELLFVKTAPSKINVPSPVIVPVNVRSPLTVSVRLALMVNCLPGLDGQVVNADIGVDTASFVTPLAGIVTSSSALGAVVESQLLPVDQSAEFAPVQIALPVDTKT